MSATSSTSSPEGSMPGQDSGPSGSQPPPLSTGPQNSNSPGPSNSQPRPTSPPDSSFTLPKLFIFKPFPAWNSPQVDERCFFYCSQTSRNRARGSDPWCRTICFRRVFGHEVHDGSYDASRDVNGFLKPQVPLPLPHEGQPREAFIDGAVEENDKTKYWKEGRYIWVSKSRWAAQEKMDSMMADLLSQADWMRYKEAVERQRYEEDMDRLRQQVRQSNEAAVDAPDTEDVETENHSQPAPEDSRGYDGPEPPPSAPDSLRFAPSSAIRDSWLFPVTPLSSVVQEALHQKLSFVLSPTYKLLTVFGRSFIEGTQARLFDKACQQATNGSTLTLVRNVWSRHETLWKELEERKEVEERKKKGGGSEVDDDGREL